MNNEFVTKTIRSLIAVILFATCFFMSGANFREAQQSFFMLGTMIIFGLLLRNIWITLFLWLTVFLYSFYKFQVGSIYLTNVFFGCVLYYITKISFSKKHIQHLVNAFLWLIALNTLYMMVQVLNLDPFLKTILFTTEGVKGTLDFTDPCGFLGYKAAMGVTVACAVPVLLSRWNLLSKIGAAGLFVPLWISRSSMSLGAAIIGVLFVLWYRIRDKRIWCAIVLALTLAGTLYVAKIDAPMGTLPTRIHQWKASLSDAKTHPITGWGLDSYRRQTPWKNFVYAMNPTKTASGVHFDYWDNPHSLYVSLFYEWGIFGLVILIGYIRCLVLWFKNAIKSPLTVGLMGFFFMVLITSVAQFPMFLARTACFIIPLTALLEVQIRE